MPSLEEHYLAAARLGYGARQAGLRHTAQRVRWSPDGRQLCYATEGASGTEHRLVDLQALTQKTVAEPPPWAMAPAAFESHEVPSPDGCWAVALDRHDLCLRGAGQADRRPLTDDGVPGWGWGDHTDFLSPPATARPGVARAPSVLWSPDSTRLAVLRSDLRRVPLQHLVQAVPADGVRPRLHSWPYPMPGDEERARHELWLIGVDGSRARAAIDGLESHFMTPLALGLLRWSADGRCLYLVDGNRTSTRLVLWRIDATDGAARVLIEETGAGVVRASAALAEPPVFHELADGRLVWWSQRSGWGHLHLIGHDGSATPITRGDWQVRALLKVDETHQRLHFSANGREPGLDPYRVQLYSVGLDGSGLQRLTPEPGHHLVQMSPDGSVFIDQHSSVTEAPTTVLRGADGTLLLTLQHADPADTWPAGMPLPEPFSATALDGVTALWGVLYKPLGFDAGRRYAVIEVIYGGPQTAVVPKGWLPNVHGSWAEQLAALGFVVMMMDGPGTPYRSHAFQRASHGHIESCGGLAEHVNAIRQLAATRPWMDLDRVGISGGSGGGYATVRAMGSFPDFFKAGVALCGNHDQAAYVAMWGETYQGAWSEALYADQASSVVAADIGGALLLVHGEMDFNVHPAMSLRVVDTMIRADRDVDLLIVPNAGHDDLALHPYVRRRAYDHFVRHLLGDTPPPRTALTARPA